MRPTTALFLALAGLAVAAAAAEPPVALRADHPMLGNWRFQLENGCVETHLINPDGTTIVTSGEEVAESAVDIADRADDAGWWRWTDRVVRDNGRPDCSDGVTPVGDVATTWARFDAAGDRMIVCYERALDRCFGPLVRVRVRRAS